VRRYWPPKVSQQRLATQILFYSRRGFGAVEVTASSDKLGALQRAPSAASAVSEGRDLECRPAVAKEHSPASITLRDLIVDELEDEDRPRLADLRGAMNDARPELSPAIVKALAAIVALPIGDRKILVGWCGRYLKRWGQIPQAAAMRSSRAVWRHTTGREKS
jgi:hypothetical protein